MTTSLAARNPQFARAPADPAQLLVGHSATDHTRPMCANFVPPRAEEPPELSPSAPHHRGEHSYLASE